MMRPAAGHSEALGMLDFDVRTVLAAIEDDSYFA